MESSTIGLQLMMRATTLQETEANLILAQLYEKGVAGSLYVIFRIWLIVFHPLNFSYSHRAPDWKTATDYYEKYIHIRGTETSNCDDNDETNEANALPFNDQHDIIARLATLYMRGEHGLERNYRKAGSKNRLWLCRLNLMTNLIAHIGDLFYKAAAMATAAMKGRLANKYYQAAEEAYALEPNDEAGDRNWEWILVCYSVFFVFITVFDLMFISDISSIYTNKTSKYCLISKA